MVIQNFDDLGELHFASAYGGKWGGGKGAYRIILIRSLVDCGTRLVDGLDHLAQVAFHADQHFVQLLGLRIRPLALAVGRLHSIVVGKLRVAKGLDLALIVVQRGSKLFLFVLELEKHRVHARLRLLGLDGLGEQVDELVAIFDEDCIPLLDMLRLLDELAFVFLDIRRPSVDDLF